MKTLFSLATLLVAVLTGRAQGSVEAMLNYVPTVPSDSSPLYSSIFSSIYGPVGWTFQPLTGMDVTALGAFNYLVPPTGSLEVGLWNANGILLASQTITDASALVNLSRYQSIAPVLLAADQTYYLAAYIPVGTLSAVVVTPGSDPNGYATLSGAVQLGQVAYNSNAGFVFPATLDGVGGDAIIAPNFEYEVVPEPAAVDLLGVGSLVGLLAWRGTFRRG